MELSKLRDLILGEEYYSIEDLRYNSKLGILMSKDELNEFFDEKERMIDAGNIHIKKLKKFFE